MNLPVLAIIGGGPAGLRAAEVAAQAGIRVALFDAKPSVGRKLLVAGRGGLNLTHGEAFDHFITRYSGPHQPDSFWKKILTEYSPTHLREWAAGLGIETFQQRTGRVYPIEMKAAPLLRRWIDRLRALGVTFHMKHRWKGLTRTSTGYQLEFECGENSSVYQASAVVLALGGGSWPLTGSDGRWCSVLQQLGINVHPLQSANCGWEHPWSPLTLEQAEGQPLKNLTVTAGHQTVSGELMVTRYGLEGGTLYQLGPILRAMKPVTISIDFKPTFDAAALLRKLPAHPRSIADAQIPWKLSDAAMAILRDDPALGTQPQDWAQRVKQCRLLLTQPRPIEEAISSAGGICWTEFDDTLMLRRLPGVYAAGEMIDWEAPTGGYLMQGCFATGTLAGQAAARRLKELDSPPPDRNGGAHPSPE